MFDMHALRSSLSLIRLVLAWFVLGLGVAVAAPVVQPATMMLICSAGGSKYVALDADGTAVQADEHSMDCPLCLPVSLPPAFISLQLSAPQAPACARHPYVAAHIAALVGAPLPARGPPRSA